jgi:hypothetical protein
MIEFINDGDRYQSKFIDSAEFDTFERFTYRNRSEFPVRSHSVRTRARMRSRGSAAARNKARSFNGVNRRGRRKYLSLVS